MDKKKALKKSKDIHKKIKRKRKGMKRTETGGDDRTHGTKILRSSFKAGSVCSAPAYPLITIRTSSVRRDAEIK